MSASASTSALLRANEAALREFLNDANHLVGIQPPPGLPPPSFGQWYYAISDGGVTGDLATNTLANDRLHAITVTITARKAYAPRDRKGQVTVSEDDLTDRAEAVADFLHMNYDVMNAANALIADAAGHEATNGFIEPLRFHGQTAPAAAPPMSPDEDSDADGDAPEILVCSVTLGDARRVRPL